MIMMMNFFMVLLSNEKGRSLKGTGLRLLFVSTP